MNVFYSFVISLSRRETEENCTKCIKMENHCEIIVYLPINIARVIDETLHSYCQLSICFRLKA